MNGWCKCNLSYRPPCQCPANWRPIASTFEALAQWRNRESRDQRYEPESFSNHGNENLGDCYLCVVVFLRVHRDDRVVVGVKDVLDEHEHLTQVVIGQELETGRFDLEIRSSKFQSKIPQFSRRRHCTLGSYLVQEACGRECWASSKTSCSSDCTFRQVSAPARTTRRFWSLKKENSVEISEWFSLRLADLDSYLMVYS